MHSTSTIPPPFRFPFMSTVLSVSEEARHEVVEFFQKVAPEADTPARANPGWLLLGSLQSLLAAESSVSSALNVSSQILGT